MAKHINSPTRAVLVVLAMLLMATRTAVFSSAESIIDAETGKECVDSNPANCPYWAQIGECEANPRYMHVHCKKSCDRCHITKVKNRNEINKIIEQRRKENAQRREASRTATATISSNGEVETVGTGATATKKENQGSPSSSFSSATGTSSSSASATKPNKKKTKIDANTGLECVDLDDNCPFWAATGDCKNNRKFMSVNCRLSCDRCHIVRVNNPDEIRKFIERKQKETEHVREAKKQQREINKILQGGEF